ncbi:MAG: hypothetical protein ACI9EM_000401 [Candidatus Thalassarchaeaceae archaeon]
MINFFSFSVSGSDSWAFGVFDSIIFIKYKNDIIEKIIPAIVENEIRKLSKFGEKTYLKYKIHENEINNNPRALISVFLFQYIGEPNKDTNIPVDANIIQGKLRIILENKSCSISDRFPRGIKIRTKPIRAMGFPRTFLRNEGPIRCTKKPEKSSKIPDHNCKSGNSMCTGLGIMYILFLLEDRLHYTIAP